MSIDSAMMIVFGRLVMVVSMLDIIESSVCDSWVVCLVGMYMFAICNCCDVEKWILTIYSSIGKVFDVLQGFSKIKSEFSKIKSKFSEIKCEFLLL